MKRTITEIINALPDGLNWNAFVREYSYALFTERSLHASSEEHELAWLYYRESRRGGIRLPRSLERRINLTLALASFALLLYMGVMVLEVVL